MRGQWLGSCNSGYKGTALVNIDKVIDHYEGSIILNPNVQNGIRLIVTFITLTLDLKQKVDGYVGIIHPKTGEVIPINGPNIEIEGVTINQVYKLELEKSGSHLLIKSKLDSSNFFEARLSNSFKNDESKVIGKTLTWQEFKNEISNKQGRLYRGQQKKWSLCTSFHRKGRYRLHNFTANDVKQLHQKLSGITSHLFDLNNPDQNGAFYSLLQHHGYPTPLLDWSYSPYVAAFFAFRDLKKQSIESGYSRIYLFDHKKWKNKFPQIQFLEPNYPHLSVTDFLAIDNPRLNPQQSATTVTNLEDIESYIQEKEKEGDTSFLEAIDISWDFRDQAMKDLAFMGITAGSMFPGIDGVCEEVRECNFDY